MAEGLFLNTIEIQFLAHFFVKINNFSSPYQSQYVSLKLLILPRTALKN